MYFNPVTAIREAVAESSRTGESPASIARRVFNRTTREQVGRAYLAVLQAFAEEAAKRRTAPVEDEEPGQVRHVSFPRVNLMPTTEDRPAAPSRSRRVAAIRAHHEGYYAQVVDVNGTRKVLGDCTLEDVRTLAAVAQNRADAEARKAAEWTDLADRMEREGASVVADVSVASAA